MKIGHTTKTAILYFGVFALIAIFGIKCQKEDSSINDVVIASALPPCDSLHNVRWADTLKVVKPGYRTISRGVFNGKPYWQAILYSGQEIKPTKFKNNPLTHRVVIADTLEITEASIFIIARIK